MPPATTSSSEGTSQRSVVRSVQPPDRPPTTSAVGEAHSSDFTAGVTHRLCHQGIQLIYKPLRLLRPLARNILHNFLRGNIHNMTWQALSGITEIPAHIWQPPSGNNVRVTDHSEDSDSDTVSDEEQLYRPNKILEIKYDEIEWQLLVSYHNSTMTRAFFNRFYISGQPASDLGKIESAADDEVTIAWHPRWTTRTLMQHLEINWSRLDVLHQLGSSIHWTAESCVCVESTSAIRFTGVSTKFVGLAPDLQLG